MKIAIVGLGYVGSVSAGCLAALGHSIIGVDIDKDKVTQMANGIAPVIEPGLKELIRKGHSDALITAVHSIDEAVQQSDIAFLAVGTPSRPDGGIDDSHLHAAIGAIADAIKKHDKSSYTVLSRSTSLPPIHRALMETLEARSGLKYGPSLAYGCHPEFLREATAVEDFFAPPKIVFGIHGEAAKKVCQELYPGIEAPTFFTDVETAAMVKYADNCFHAVKVTFGNEIGMICRELNVDSHKVMDLFCADRKLNISDKYLRPGTPFGGSCLPKDLRGILHASAESNTPLKMLTGTYESNQTQIEALLSRINEVKPKTVGIVGLSFKSGTPDLRESPTVSLLNTLTENKIKVIAYDEELSKISPSTNSGYDPIAPLRKYLTPDLAALVHTADVLVVHHPLSAAQWDKVVFNGGTVIDLSNNVNLKRSEHYQGLYW